MQLGLIRELIGLLPVGKQWGYYDKGDNSNSWTLPITFPNQCWAVVCSSRYDNNAYATSWSKTIVNGDLRVGDRMKYGCWVAFGN